MSNKKATNIYGGNEANRGIKKTVNITNQSLKQDLIDLER